MGFLGEQMGFRDVESICEVLIDLITFWVDFSKILRCKYLDENS